MTDTHESDEEQRRKRLIRIVIVLAVAVPIVVEGATFGGLLTSTLLGTGGDDGSTALNDTTTTAASGGVGIGDELLPSTPQHERITAATVRTAGNDWRLSLSVTVNNTDNRTYQLQLGAVETTGETRVANDVSVIVPPGANRTTTGEWALPAGERPRTVEVVAVSNVGGNASITRRTVDLASIPVEGA